MSVLATALCLALSVHAPAPAAREWPMPRHDRTLSNQAAVRGDLRSAPRELWRLDTAEWGGDLEVAAGSGPAQVRLDQPIGEVARRDGGRGGRRRARRSAWQKRMLDVSGTGVLVQVPPRSYWGPLVPGRRGLQSVAWTSTWGDAPSKLQCFSYEGGFDRPRLEWETPPENVVYSPLTLIADVNGDGRSEVAVAMHYRIMIFEGATGRKITELKYHNLRNYGFFGMFIDPGDHGATFVNISDFANHFDVVRYDGHEMRVAFRRDIQGADGGGIQRHRKIIANGPNPLEDIDGDGRTELVFNLYNDTGDERWHVMAYEPLTGTVKLDLPGQYLEGLYDVDGCGKPELLLRGAPGRQVTGWSRLTVRRLRGRRLQTQATFEDARFADITVSQLPPTADDSSGASAQTAGAGRIGPRGEPGLLILRPGADRTPVRLEAHVRRAGRFEVAWAVAAPVGGTVGARRVEGRSHGDAPPAGAPATVLAGVTSPSARAVVQVRGVRAAAVRWSPGAKVPPAPIVVRSGARTLLVTDTSGDRIRAYDATAASGAPRLLWQRPGRGMGTGSGSQGPLSAGDLDGDGSPEILYASEDRATGSAALIAARADGATLWQHVFPGTNSGRPAWNMPGLTLWTPAHLTDRRRMDVYVNTRRSSMHSDASFALDGRTGRTLWSGDAVPIDGVAAWGFGGTLVAFTDRPGSGLDQIVSLYPVCYYVVDGRTGRFVRTLDLATQKVLPGWAAYAVPVVRDFLGAGGAQVLVASPYVYGLLALDGKPIWSAPTVAALGNTPRVAGAEVGDYDGDGVLEVARLFAPGMVGPDAKLEFLDARTGRTKGSALTGPTLLLDGAVTADVDGDGADELLMRTAPATLAAISLRGGVPHELWRVPLPADPAATIAVDPGGGRRCVLIAGCVDGHIVALGR